MEKSVNALLTFVYTNVKNRGNHLRASNNWFFSYPWSLLMRIITKNGPKKEESKFSKKSWIGLPSFTCLKSKLHISEYHINWWWNCPFFISFLFSSDKKLDNSLLCSNFTRTITIKLVHYRDTFTLSNINYWLSVKILVYYLFLVHWITSHDVIL